MTTTNRRTFLGGIGATIGYATLGFALSARLGFAESLSRTTRERLRFGPLDALVDLLQETPPDALLPLLVRKLRDGTTLSDLVAAGALANARAHGGTNYDGYHCLMAMLPSYEMAAQMPAPFTALPVLKVLHRNACYLHEAGRAKQDALQPIDGGAGQASLVTSVRARDLPQAERSLAALAVLSRDEAYEALQTVVRDDVNVHRIVLAWRAYDLLRLTGPEQAVTMLRQSVRFCIAEDGQRAGHGQESTEVRELLPELMGKYGLDKRERGTRAAGNAWIDQLSQTVFAAGRSAAAEAAAAALAEGYDPNVVSAAMSLAAVRLLLHDRGQTQAAPGKPVGSVHGASVGVHASDAANAWKHVAGVGSAQNAFASLIVGAYHTAGQSDLVGALPYDHDGDACRKEDPVSLLSEIDGRIRDSDQKGTCRAARRYCELGHPPADLFRLLLLFAVSEDGALHAEKFFRTAQEEHSSAHPQHQALYLVALSRVMASHYGFPAPGCEEARKLLAG